MAQRRALRCGAGYGVNAAQLRPVVKGQILLRNTRNCLYIIRALDCVPPLVCRTVGLVLILLSQLLTASLYSYPV